VSEQPPLAEREIARDALWANVFGFGLVWAIAGLAWAGALGAPLLAGLLGGALFGALGAAVMALFARNAYELAASALSPSWFGVLATLAIVTGAVVWIA
jgi:hypothetical protein